jgi:hypothetical protein
MTALQPTKVINDLSILKIGETLVIVVAFHIFCNISSLSCSFIILLDKQVFLISDFLDVELQDKNGLIQRQKAMYGHLVLLEY